MPPTMLSVNEPAAATQTDARAGKYLTFQLAQEEFGIRVLKVREIMGLQDITAVPQTPSHVKGVINLRGKVVPVIDLRLKFGMPAAEYTRVGDDAVEPGGLEVVEPTLSDLHVLSAGGEDPLGSAMGGGIVARPCADSHDARRGVGPEGA